MAAPTDSRLGPGTLKLGAPLVDYGRQISNVSLEPNQDSNAGTPTLGDPDPLPELTESWSLKGEAIQDFEDAAGFVNWCADHALESVAFEWVPNSDLGTKWTGDCLVTSLPVGGDVSSQNTSKFEFAVQGAPTRVDPPAGALASRSEKVRQAREARRNKTKRSTAEKATR